MIQNLPFYDICLSEARLIFFQLIQENFCYTISRIECCQSYKNREMSITDTEMDSKLGVSYVCNEPNFQV